MVSTATRLRAEHRRIYDAENADVNRDDIPDVYQT